MSFYEPAIVQHKKLLVALDKWIQKAIAHAGEKKFDPNILASARLAPDMYPFVKQVQAVCDMSKFGAARLTAKEPPKHEDNEKTLDELRARIRLAVTYLDGFERKDFEGADARPITLPFLEGKVMTGSDYFCEFVQPNFYFHLTTAYAILRHNGVPLGKMDFIDTLSTRDR